MKLITVKLNSGHRKSEFSCSKEMLDSYLHRQANQDVKRKLSATFVLEDKETLLIKGYYTLANHSIPRQVLHEEIKKKLPRSYLAIPTILLGRLAIDKNFQGKGIGKILLVDALFRSYHISKSIGSFAVVVDPLDEEAEMFYEKFGFIMLQDSNKMFLPMKTIKSQFE